MCRILRQTNYCLEQQKKTNILIHQPKLKKRKNEIEFLIAVYKTTLLIISKESTIRMTLSGNFKMIHFFPNKILNSDGQWLLLF